MRERVASVFAANPRARGYVLDDKGARADVVVMHALSGGMMSDWSRGTRKGVFSIERGSDRVLSDPRDRSAYVARPFRPELHRSPDGGGAERK